jgi:hypothetical protein
MVSEKEDHDRAQLPVPMTVDTCYEVLLIHEPVFCCHVQRWSLARRSAYGYEGMNRGRKQLV